MPHPTHVIWQSPVFLGDWGQSKFNTPIHHGFWGVLRWMGMGRQQKTFSITQREDPAPAGQGPFSCSFASCRHQRRDAGELEICEKWRHLKSRGKKWTHPLVGSNKPEAGWYGFGKRSTPKFDWLISCRISLQPLVRIMCKVKFQFDRADRHFLLGHLPERNPLSLGTGFFHVFPGIETKRYWLKLKQKKCCRLFKHAQTFLATFQVFF